MRMPDAINLTRRWRLGERLGTGGFATVHLVQSEDGESAVVKLIPKDPGAERELLFDNFDGVPNVVPVLDRGKWDNYWVMVMPLAEKSLRDYLVEMGGRLDVDVALPVLVDIAEALVAIENRVVHRDIKPDNVLLLNSHWCLADFGIARYAHATTAADTRKYAMTHAYAAPEQWREERASSATDVYALGIIAYELLAGQRPFQGPNPSDYRHQHLESSVEPMVGVPVRLQSLIGECLYKPPQARPAPQNLLARLKASVQAASPAAARLQEANALAVQQKAENERQDSAAQVAAKRRSDLCKVADQSLEDILGLLDQQIRTNAPAVQASKEPRRREWSLNGATLRVDRALMAGEGSSEGMPFEVMERTKISLTVPIDRDGYSGRSHSLWYCDAQQPDAFRWYETAFCQRLNRNKVEPFALAPGGDHVVPPLSGVMHTVQLAWPFTSIDQGDEESFIERWIEWFAEAAQGQLRRPRRMPERDASGSWRR